MRGGRRVIFFCAGVGELRQARARDEVGAGDEIADGLAHGLRAEQQRLRAAARVQQAVGEDVAALGIGGELDLVDGEEIDVDVARHRLDRAHPIARPLRLDLLLAGDQRDLVGADAGGDLVVDLAREQAQRQADHAAVVAEHALDREVGLAGVGGPEHGRHIADARFEIEAHSQASSSDDRAGGIAEWCGKIKGRGQIKLPRYQTLRWPHRCAPAHTVSARHGSAASAV